MSKMMVKRDGLWTPMANLKGDTGPLPADNSVTNDALVTDGAKTNTAYLMGNRWTKDAEGELISVDDSYPSAALSLTVDGKSTQLTTTGKNLCPHKRSQWTFIRLSQVGGGTVVASGGTGHYCVAVPLEEGQSITWHRNTSAASPGFFRTCSDYPPVVGTTISPGVTLTNHTTYTLTNNDGTKPCALLFATVNGMPSDEALEKMQAQLEYGTSFTSYEPYSGGAASPRPDWPQDITNIDALMTAVNGKNIVSPTTVTSTKTSNGISYEWDGEKLNASGTSTVNNSDSMQIAIDNAPIMFAGIKYTFSLQGTFNTGASGTTFYFRTSKRGETSQTLRYIFGTANKNSWTYTPTEDMVLRAFTLRIGSSGNTVNISARLQLEIGSTATEYQPYSGVTASLDLSEEPLRSLPDGTKDELHLTYIRPSTREGWAVYQATLTQRVGSVDLGDFTWGKRPNQHKWFTDIPMLKSNTSANCRMCSHYTVIASQNVGSTPANNTISPRAIDGSHRVFVRDDRYPPLSTTFEGFRTAVMGVRFDYLMEDYQTHDLGIFELPAMQSGITHLWSDPSTNLSVTYERDRNIVITNLKAAVADLVTS